MPDTPLQLRTSTEGQIHLFSAIFLAAPQIPLTSCFGQDQNVTRAQSTEYLTILHYHGNLSIQPISEVPWGDYSTRRDLVEEFDMWHQTKLTHGDTYLTFGYSRGIFCATLMNTQYSLTRRKFFGLSVPASSNHW